MSSVLPVVPQKQVSTPRLKLLDGVRGYLAVLVSIGHVIWSTGYSTEHAPKLLQILGKGGTAVSFFLILSGFVIFMLIDSKREPFRVFITRRFFRLFPVYAVLLPLAVCAFYFEEQAFGNLSFGLLDAGSLPGFVSQHQLAAKNIVYHFLAHVSMLHGLIPSRWLPAAAHTLLVPAWTVSLEWQFYLIAPLLFRIIAYKGIRENAIICLLGVGALLLRRQINASGLILPTNFLYIYTGMVCYFVFKKLDRSIIKPDMAFFGSCTIAFLILRISNWPPLLFPVLGWFAVFGLLFEPASSLSVRCIGPFLLNGAAQWLGSLSYCYYLSHWIVLVFMKWALISWAPHLTRMQHLEALIILVIMGSIAISAMLYYAIEIPFSRIGAAVAKRFDAVGKDLCATASER